MSPIANTAKAPYLQVGFNGSRGLRLLLRVVEYQHTQWQTSYEKMPPVHWMESQNIQQVLPRPPTGSIFLCDTAAPIHQLPQIVMGKSLKSQVLQISAHHTVSLNAFILS